jgi:L-fuconolactonase
MQPDPEPFAALGELVALAVLPNVAVKFSGAPTLSRGPYPFGDLWPHLHRVVESFGPERLIWAADYPRVDDHSYGEALGYILYSDELSQSDKALILGGAARRVFAWPTSIEAAA